MSGSYLVSVIVPAYNAEGYIGHMLECILNQTYGNIQVIVVNDGSSDKTGELCEEYCRRDSRIEYYFQNNQGVSAARNYGIRHIKGKKVFFFDADDSCEKDLIEKCVSYADAQNVESVLYGYADKQGKTICNEHVFKLHGNFRGGGRNNFRGSPVISWAFL